MSINVDAVRRDTPACLERIHFNNAGSALPPQPVVNAMVNYLQLEATLGGYEAADARASQIQRTYDAAAQLLNCSPDEIAIVENATRAWDMAFYAFQFQPGERILTSIAEYASNYIAYLQVCRRTGATVEAIPNDESGQLSIEALEAMIDDRVKLIAITHIPTNGGLVNPAVQVGQIARRYKIPFLLDACQSVGQLPMDVTQIQCDMLSATGRKFLRGPRGTGLLYVRKTWIEQLEPPMLDLHAATWLSPNHYEIRPDAKRFENWETNYAGKVGLGVAIDYALDLGLENIQARINSLAGSLRDQLQSLPAISLCDLGPNPCGIVTFTVEDHPAEQVAQYLRDNRINVSYSPKEYTRLDMTQRGLDAVVRASVHYYNTHDEIDRFMTALKGYLR